MRRLGEWAGRAFRLARLPEWLAVALPILYFTALVGERAWLSPDRHYIGFAHADAKAYYAMAREVFENGNGLIFASPYSNRPDSPRIYSSLEILLFGYLWKYLGLSFGTIDAATRLACGILMLWLIVRLFRALLPPGPFATLGAVAVVGCGGIAWMVALLQMAQTWRIDPGMFSTPGQVANFFADTFGDVESGYGGWSLNLSGLLNFSTETFYHVLFFASILCLARRRWWWSILFLFLAWWSHPFTGVELGLIVAVALAVECLMGGRRRPWKPLAAATAINAAFLAYHFFFLTRFDEHRAVSATFHAASHSMLVSKLPAAYGAFLIVPCFYLTSRGAWRRWRRRRPFRLMLAWLVGAAALVFHDRFLPARLVFQPLHFTRGYLFTPLVYFTALALHDWSSGLGQKRARDGTGRRRWLIVAACAAILLQFPDNPIRTAIQQKDLLKDFHSYSVRRQAKDLLTRLDRIGPTETILCVNLPKQYYGLEAWIPVLTHHRALLGHVGNTPDYQRKWETALPLGWSPDAATLAALRLTMLIVPESYLPRLAQAIGPAGYETVMEAADGVRVVRLNAAAARPWRPDRDSPR